MSDNIDRLSNESAIPEQGDGNTKKTNIDSEETKIIKLEREKLVVDKNSRGGYQIKGDISDINEMKGVYSSVKEQEILNNAERQINARNEGIRLGLKGDELRDFIIEQTKDISVHTKFAEIDPERVLEVVYDEDEVVYDTTTELDKKKSNKITFSPNEVIIESPQQNTFTETSSDREEEEEFIRNNEIIQELTKKMDYLIEQLSVRQDGSEFDYVKVPSLCKQYQLKGNSLQVSFLNGADEDVLTNPNVWKSGRFLEILFKRKLLDKQISYDDLLEQDVTAILFWLRVTAYGEVYPVNIKDKTIPDDLGINVDVNLANLPVTYLELETNERGLFEYQTKSHVFEFKFLTIGDKNKLDKEIQDKIDNNELFLGLTAEALSHMVKRLDGETNPNEIKRKLNTMRLGELREFKNYIAEKSQFGVKSTVKVKNKKGEVTEIQFPIEPHFFGLE